MSFTCVFFWAAYDKALQICQEEDKSHVLVAMAMVAYKFNDVAGAKSLFFKRYVMEK